MSLFSIHLRTKNRNQEIQVTEIDSNTIARLVAYRFSHSKNLYQPALRSLALLAIFVLITVPAIAESVPSSMNYQGELVKPEGDPWDDDEFIANCEKNYKSKP